MWKDPIVEEVRNAGAKVAKECDYDIHKMAERFRKTQLEFERKRSK